jgi:enoyl-CoA hydratase/carnithine racemase
MQYKQLTIQGPGPNALSPTELTRLLGELEEAGDAPIVLTGDGEAFSAGLDLKALVDMSASDFEDFLGDLETFARRLFLHPAPTVAVLNGHCVAAGYMLAAACEHRVAAAEDSLKLGLPAVKLGLQYPPTLLAIIRYTIPQQYHEEILLGSRAVPAVRGLAMGLIEEMAEDPMERGLRWLEKRASLPRDAYGATKRTLREEHVEISDAERKRFKEQVVPSWSDPERIDRMLKAIGK